MSTSTLHPAARDYLRKVRREGRDLPTDRLDELMRDLEEHLAASIPSDASDAQAGEVLERLGDPREVTAAARPESTAAAQRRGAREWAAIFLLLFGFFALVVGWFAGLFLLWSSRAWTTRDKLVGTFLLPGGLFTSALLVLIAGGSPHKERCVSRSGGVLHCTSVAGNGPSAIVSVVLILIAVTPVASAVLLARRAR